MADALGQFDRVATNLAKTERLWGSYREAVPEGLSLSPTPPEIAEVMRSFAACAGALPQIEGFRVDARPLEFDEVGQYRLDAREVGFPEAETQVERTIEEPGRQLAEYRHRFDRARRHLVRDHVSDIRGRIDVLLADVEVGDGRAEWKGEGSWDDLSREVQSLARLLGGQDVQPRRWNDMRRHVRFAEPHDLHDIVSFDWPAVRSSLTESLYGEDEPVPVLDQDLAALVSSKPTGAVGVAIDWSTLDETGFERLLYELLRAAAGYENVSLPMKTNAADGGRDVQAYYITVNPLAGTRRDRFIVQCKHWQAKSVSRNDVALLPETVKEWELPLVDVIVVATSGHFSKSAVQWAEARDVRREVPAVLLWPKSHLESLLADYPTVAAELGLKRLGRHE